MNGERVYKMPVSSVYPHYIAKAEKNGRTKEEVDKIIIWLTGYTDQELSVCLDTNITFDDFFSDAPRLNPNRALITGTICGYKIEDMEQSLMKEIRYMDKLIDELAKGKTMDTILRRDPMNK